MLDELWISRHGVARTSGQKLHSATSINDVGIAITGWHGFGIVPTRDDRVDQPREHGIIDLTKFYGARVFDATAVLKGTSLSDLADVTDAFNLALTIRDNPLRLFFKRLGRAYYEWCDVVPGVVDEPYELPSGVVECSFQLIAADPRIYKDEDATVADATSGATVTNGGNIATPLVITIGGASSGLQGIENTSRSVENVLQFTAPLGGGDEVVIDTDAKSIELNGVSTPSLLDAENSSFWKLAAGANVLAPIGSPGSISVAWHDARSG